jgi:hypothetical protein
MTASHALIRSHVRKAGERMAALWGMVCAAAHTRACRQAELWCRASVLVQLRERDRADLNFELETIRLMSQDRRGDCRKLISKGQSARSSLSENKSPGPRC